MDANLRELFDRALDDEPTAPPDLARTAMAQGTRLRRRRKLIIGGAGGLTAAIAAVLALNLIGTGAAGPAPIKAAGLAARTGSECVAVRDGSPALNLSIFVRPDITEAETVRLANSLYTDGRWLSMVYESREQAFMRFKELWKDNPDLAKNVQADQLPASYRLRLRDPKTAPAVESKYRGMAGVSQIVADSCAAGRTPGDRK